MKNVIVLRFFLISLVSLVSPAEVLVHGQDRMSVNDSLSFEVILTEKMFPDFKPAGSFIPSIDITSERFILLSVPDQYYVLGWGGIVPLGSRMNKEIQSFAFTPDGLLLSVRGNELCSFDISGNLTVMARLPRNGMGISAGQEVIYLFDRSQGQKTYPLYVFARQGRYLKLIESPDPIASVAETGEAVIFAAGSRLYSVNPVTKEVKLLFSEERGRKILSVTVDGTGEIAYFSTADMIFAMKDSDLAVISEKSGGLLRYFNGLIVFNPEARQVVRILGLEDELVVTPQRPGEVTFKQGPASQDSRAPAAGISAAAVTVAATETSSRVSAHTTGQSSAQTAGQSSAQTAGQAVAIQSSRSSAAEGSRVDTTAASQPAASASAGAATSPQKEQAGDIGTVKVLTNESVVALVTNELADKIIINLIRRAKVDFSLTTDDVIELSGKGVSPELIREMRLAMQGQASENQNR